MSSSESSTIVVKARPMLSDMPDKIKELIAEQTNLKTRYRLRKVSTHFRAAVDASEYYFEYVRFEAREDNKMKLLVNGYDIRYKKNEGNGCLVKLDRKLVTVIEGEDYIQRAVDDLAIILKSPKVYVKSLELNAPYGTRSPAASSLRDKLDTFRYQLNVVRLDVDDSGLQEDVLRVVRHVKPRVLEKLIVADTSENIDQVVQTEHWQFLKHAKVGNVERVPISKFLHLKQFVIRRFPLTEDDVEELIQSILQHPNNFESYCFNIDEGQESPEVQRWERAASRYLTQNPRDIPIPGTDYTINIWCVEYGLYFTRRGGREVE